MSQSKIEWTEHTWNPTTGCTKISPGCKYCYAENMAIRLQKMKACGYENGFKLTLHENRLVTPLKRKKPTIYFVNSMSDLFHEKVPFSFIDKVFDVARKTPHTFLIVTKRANRMKKYFSKRAVPENVWLGVTVEDRENGYPRIDALRDIDAPVKFLSIEPLLEDLHDISLEKIDWVIVGGESGSKARPMKEEWVSLIKDRCTKSNVMFFFKQWGTWGSDGIKRHKKNNGRELFGKFWNQRPNPTLACKS